MKAKIVRYNGKTATFYGCSDPAKLVVGKEYEVTFKVDLGCQTNYTLRGVQGEYNALWFDDVSAAKKVYLAIGYTVPVVEMRYFCYKVEYPNFYGTSTSTVKEVKTMGNNIYHVKTCNSTYLVQVLA